MKKKLTFVLAVALLTTSCYHAVVETGKPASGQTITKKWAHGFVHGLVPPDPIESQGKCPNGVSKVETKLSFMNQLATVITGGIYSPMTIEVSCAQ